MAKVNYTPEQVDQAKTMYAELGNEGIDAIAEALAKTKRSIISKLAREGVYVKEEVAAAAPKPQGPTHKELGQVLDGLGVEYKHLQGATKAGLESVIAVIKAAKASVEVNEA
jgi:hypothetical protein